MDHYSKENFPLTYSVGFFLNRARNSLMEELDAALKELGISSQHMGILLSMLRGSASTPFELCKRLGVDTGLMTRMLDKLENEGLLKRSRSVSDRRVVNLVLTDKGRAITEQVSEIAPQVLNARLTAFSPDEFAEFSRLLVKFASA
ncbi:MarR family winged helix-turn-helix transcriptional regulator [Cupriavidus sp. M-11]|uniref:MarR family winged helix-turn-helix transcriptional regulator n=1 Tax=Cupriavidus sp. M-11 TaxID=3233038 RepID=UPI003F93C4BC